MKRYTQLMKYIFGLGLMMVMVGCATNLREVIVDTPSEIRIVSGEFTRENLLMLDEVLYQMLMIEKCQGVKLQYINGPHSNNLFDEKDIKPNVFSSMILDDSCCVPPWVGGEDKEGTEAEIVAAFTELQGNKEDEIKPRNRNLTSCKIYPSQSDNKKWLFVSIQHHGERSASGAANPYRFVVFSAGEKNRYKKVLDIYTNIINSKWKVKENVWYLTGGDKGENCWRVVFD